MSPALAFVLLPLTAFLVLAALPRGPRSIATILACAALLGLIRLTLAPEEPPEVRRAIVTLLLAAAGLAALVQTVRHLLPHTVTGWIYPSLVALAPFAALALALAVTEP